MSARSLGIEFALAPLMRGEWRATELHLAGPQISLGLDASGQVQAPNIAVRFNPDALAVERLSIEDGKVTLTDAASGASVTLDRLWFNGEARSLIGPVKGEGAVTIGGELYPFRIATGRYDDEGALHLHVNVDPVNHPLSIETDGTLTLADGKPRYEGTLNLARPVGIASHSTARLTQPWRVSSKLKVTAQSALMEQVDFQYGSEEQGSSSAVSPTSSSANAPASMGSCRPHDRPRSRALPPATAAVRCRPPPFANWRSWAGSPSARPSRSRSASASIRSRSAAVPFRICAAISVPIAADGIWIGLNSVHPVSPRCA